MTAQDYNETARAVPGHEVGVMQVPDERCDASLLGIGLDSDDEQVRVTRGENFRLIGGSRETHESMQEKCIRFNEKLQDRGKALPELERDEFLEIAAECEMNVATPKRRNS